jgi:flagellar hook-associated protein 2
MGTVGISFGSPTSGVGFDVSSTVAQIVGNLQNVEAPWKTQLTSLGSQDTAISSLGTLMSSLSNDISQLTDFQGIMAQKTGSSSDTNVLELTSASSSATAGTHSVVVTSLATTSSGYLAPIANASDMISGSITLQVGTTGKPQTITLNTSNDTLTGLAAAINSSGVGVTASVLTDSSGSRLSLVSGTSGADGSIIVSSNSNPLVDTSNSNAPLDYTASSVVPADAVLTVDGVAGLTSPSNTVTNLIPGLTFQLLAPSAKESDGTLESVQVVIGNDTTAIESTVNQMVSDYNSLTSAINAQSGNDSSGNSEPLFGSPTLSLLQQQLMNGLNTQNPNGSLDSISTNTGTTLTGSISITLAGGFWLNYAGTAGTSSAASTGTMTANSADTLAGSISIQVGDGTAQTVVLTSADNTISGLADAINTAGIGVTATVTTTDGVSTLSLLSLTPGKSGTLTVGSSIRDTSTQTVTLTPADNTLSGMAAAINAANIGVTANVVTNGTQSSLSLGSQTAGSSGALTVDSNIVATSEAPLSYSGQAGSSTTTPFGILTTTSTGTLTSIPGAGDALSGSVSIQVGGGNAQTVSVPSPDGTLNGLMNAINNTPNLGVTASIMTNSNGSSSLSLLSGTAGTAGTLTVTSNILDTTNTSSATLNYTNSSDVSTLANLGVTVSMKDDGSLTFNATTLDSVLNSDYNGVLGFFQDVNSWGQTFSNMLTNAGSSSPTGILSLAAGSNSSIESTLNADISKEELSISAQQKTLTAELNNANEILQELPSQLAGVNELYSAITGYNQNSGG